MTQSKKYLFWQKHLRAWETSGLTQAAYCQRHRLSLASFGYWRTRGKQTATEAAAIIPVVREPVYAGVQLRSPGGWQIALPASLDFTELRALLATLP